MILWFGFFTGHTRKTSLCPGSSERLSGIQKVLKPKPELSTQTQLSWSFYLIFNHLWTSADTCCWVRNGITSPKASTLGFFFAKQALLRPSFANGKLFSDPVQLFPSLVTSLGRHSHGPSLQWASNSVNIRAELFLPFIIQILIDFILHWTFSQARRWDNVKFNLFGCGHYYYY